MSDLFEDLDQQRAAGEEHDAEALIRSALDLVQTAKAMPLSASVLVSREELAELLQAALDRMPDELRQARWLLKERDEFLAEKSREADNLLEEVRVQAERMVQRTEIVRQANHVAQRILDDANEEARRLRHEAEDYADQKLASFEIVLDRTMKTVQAGREKLQVTPLAQGGDRRRRGHVAGPEHRSTGRARESTTPKASSIRTSTEPTDPVRTEPRTSEPDPARATGAAAAPVAARGGRDRRRARRPFIVQVAALRKQAGSVRHEVRQGGIEGLSAVGVSVPDGAPVVCDLTLASYPGGIMVTGTVGAPWVGECRRCGGPVSGRVDAAVRERYAPRPDWTEDEDAYLLAGDELDLEPLARDAVMLDLPLAPLCSPDCLGLCPRCGAEPERLRLPLSARRGPPVERARRPAWPGGRRIGLGCHPYGRSEEEDLEVEEPQPPGIQLGAEGAGTLDVPAVHLRQDPPCRLPELRLVQRPTGHRSRVVARGGARPEGEEFASLPVVVDAMGGDRAPGEIVAGAREVAERTDIKVALVGRPGEMGDIGDLPCFPASEVIGMDDDPGNSVRRKKDSSLVRAAEAVRDGRAMAMVSAGNTGASHGLGPAADGPVAQRHPAGHRHPDPLSRRTVAHRAPRLGGQRRVHAPDAGAVRPDGGGIRRQALRDRTAPGGPPLHRGGEVQGHAAGEGDVRLAGRRRGRPRIRFRGQRGGARLLHRDDRCHRHRRLHRQCRPQDAGGIDALPHRGPHRDSRTARRSPDG